MNMFKYEKDGLTSYALGTQATFYLLEAKPEIAKRIYISPKQVRDETYERLIALAKANKIPVIENNEKIFKDLSGKENTMVIGEFLKEESPLDPLASHVLLVNPSNAGNLGSIFRSLVGFGLKDIALITPCVDPFDPKVVRASMGALFHLNLHRYKDFESYHLDAGERSFFPFLLKAKTLLQDHPSSECFTLIFGNEATGLPDSFYEVGTPLKIPQTELIDSLNLNNAVAISLYEFQKGKVS